MSKYYVLVAGKGATSRQNVEALMEDHYYAKGDGGTVVIAIEKMATPSQVFVAQFAKDKNKEIVLVAKPDADLGNMPAASVVHDDEPIKKSVEIVAGADTSAFLLWDDGDEASLAVLASCKKAGIPCYDLINGLSEITPSETLKEPEPTLFPQAEMVTESEETDEEEEEVDEEEATEEDDDEEYEDDEDIEDIYAGIEAIARVFAKVFIEEWKAQSGPKP
jgi:hypothetical protein